jgi:hypothetical protein
MARKLPPELQAAMAGFRTGGVKPALLVARRWAPPTPALALFADDLRAEGWSTPETPAGWDTPSLPAGIALLAFCRHRSLAYDFPYGSVDESREAADALARALAVQRIQSSSTLYKIIDPVTLRLPARGYSYASGSHVTGATFEQVVLLEGSEFAALVVWTDED